MNRREFLKSSLFTAIGGMILASCQKAVIKSKKLLKGDEMKKILIVNASPRKNGNSDTICQMLAKDLKNHEVIVFNISEKNCNHCLACGACQNKDTQMCVQKDDISELLPVIDKCDAIVMATPIYNQQVTARAKLFIERWYPFFKYNGKLMSNTSKYSKKGAIICSFWGSPVENVTKYANWTLDGFSQIGVEDKKTLIFPQIPNRGDVLKHEDYVKQIHDLSSWLVM